MLQYTFAIIKSAAVTRKQSTSILSAMSHIQARAIVTEHRFLIQNEVEMLYQEHLTKPFWPMLYESVTGKDGVICMILHGDQVVAKWRELMGATDPHKSLPGTIRFDYGVADADNAVHGSATPADAIREIDIFYPCFLTDIIRMGHGAHVSTPFYIPF